MQNQNSGGWRYGNGSNDFLYKNEGIDNELLKRAAAMTEAPKGLLDQAVQVNPLDVLMQQDKGYGSGGSGNGQSGLGGTPANGNVSNTMGVESQFGWGGPSLNGAKAGAPAFGLPGAILGGLLGGITSNSFSNQQTVDAFDMSNFGITSAQINAERAASAAKSYANIDANTPAGGATGGFQSSYGSGSVGGTDGGLGNSSGKSGGTGEGSNGNAGNGRD